MLFKNCLGLVFCWCTVVFMFGFGLKFKVDLGFGLDWLSVNLRFTSDLFNGVEHIYLSISSISSFI